MSYVDQPLGIIISSILDYTAFCQILGEDSSTITTPAGIATLSYVPCDGRSIAGSMLATKSGGKVLLAPDLRGKFLRGLNQMCSASPSTAAFTAATQGDTQSGRVAGDYQADMNKAHNHQASNTPQSFMMGGTPNGFNVPTYQGNSNAVGGVPGITVNNDGGAESRPRNVSIYFYIKINSVSTTSALAFNGVDTYIEVNAPLPFTTQITIEMWMRGVPKNAFLFFVTNDAHGRQLSAHVPYGDGNVYFDGGADAGNNYDRIIKGLTPIDDQNTWNHWAFVRNSDSGRMAIYRNGVIWLDQPSGCARPMAPCNRLVIGADGDGNWYHCGAISEIRLWNVERTAAQISDNMNRILTGVGADTGLIASYSLDAYQAGQLIGDRSGGGRHGTLHGAPVSVPAPRTLAK